MPKNAIKYQVTYDRENRKYYGINLMKTTDSDIIEYLDKQANKQNVIKEAIREKIARELPDQDGKA